MREIAPNTQEDAITQRILLNSRNHDAGNNSVQLDFFG